MRQAAISTLAQASCISCSAHKQVRPIQAGSCPAWPHATPPRLLRRHTFRCLLHPWLAVDGQRRWVGQHQSQHLYRLLSGGGKVVG